MSLHRFYASPGDIDGSTIHLSGDETHHLIRVLRLKPGDEALAFDGCGREFRCRVAAATGSRARLEIIDSLTNAVESPLDLTLAQAIAKGEKFDFIVQKATELGVSRIVPIITDHTDVKIKAEAMPKKLERWRRISLEALKQCGRRTLVEITSPRTVPGLLDALKNMRPADALAGTQNQGVVLVFSEKGGMPVTDALANAKGEPPVTALIGPEGGWSEAELSLLNERGAKAVSLGPRVLRAETAALVAIALIQHALGDLSRITQA